MTVTGCRSPAGNSLFRKCANYTDHHVCNWMVPAGSEDPFCVACRLNRTIPNLEIEGNRILWHKLEIEKRRLVFTLCVWGFRWNP